MKMISYRYKSINEKRTELITFEKKKTIVSCVRAKLSLIGQLRFSSNNCKMLDATFPDIQESIISLRL